MRGVRECGGRALLVALGLIVTPVAAATTRAATPAPAAAPRPSRSAWSTTSGAGATKSFNDSAYAGLEAARQEQGDKIEARDVSPNPDGSNRKELLDRLADDGYGLVFGVGFLFSEDIAKSATEAPTPPSR